MKRLDCAPIADPLRGATKVSFLPVTRHPADLALRPARLATFAKFLRLPCRAAP